LSEVPVRALAAPPSIAELSRLDGCRALVIGGAGDLGMEIVDTLAELGAEVGLAGRRIERCEAVAEEIARRRGVRPACFATDATDPESLRDLIAAFRQTVGPVERLVFNAGAFAAGEVWELSRDRWRQTFSLNVEAPFFAVQECFEDLRASRGAVVFISSVGGMTSFRRSVAKLVPYTTSKAALNHLARDLAAQLADFGIRVNAIAPGSIDAGMTTTLPAASRDELEASVPLGRLGRPDDLRGAIAIAVSDLSAYVTGQVLVVDGGLTLV
jgi:gluconate 5-dehydrogenase